MQVKFKAKEKGEQPKLFTQLPHRYKYFTKHPLEKHPKGVFFFVAKKRFEHERQGLAREWRLRARPVDEAASKKDGQ